MFRSEKDIQIPIFLMQMAQVKQNLALDKKAMDKDVWVEKQVKECREPKEGPSAAIILKLTYNN